MWKDEIIRAKSCKVMALHQHSGDLAARHMYIHRCVWGNTELALGSHPFPSQIFYASIPSQLLQIFD
jgi:hypothetical protein